ncbi:PEBP-like protein [Astrocystis sublimbata]|nr:PEBP-like protein [Astrocystis sublimbata]
MVSKFLVALAASGALAATPKGFEPGSENPLLVTFGKTPAQDGVEVAKDITQTAPTLATQSKLDGSSFAVMMIDLDIPTDNPPETGTLLHWMQTGLTQSASAVSNSSAGATSFAFSVPADEAALADYLGPSPPAKIPLSHRYTEIIVDTSDLTDTGLAALKKAAGTRLGFNAKGVMTEAGLLDKVVAGNFFNVTNPGPLEGATASNSTTGSGSGSGSNGTISGGSPSSSSNPSPSSPPSGRPDPSTAGAQRVGSSLFGIVMAAVAVFAL